MSEKGQIKAIPSIQSVDHVLDTADHEIDLHAIQSQAISVGDVGTSLTGFQNN